MKNEILKFSFIYLLLLPLFVVLIGAGCEDENISEEHSLIGSWQIDTQNISGELKSCINPPENALFPDISIVVPDTTKGLITGNTFYNTFGVGFEIKDKQHIEFENHLATRIAEDDCGSSFGENLRSTVRFDFSKDKLLFIDSDEQIIIVFKKKSK